MVTTTAGRIATTRVTSRRSQGATRKFKNPSITIWPDSVAVMVEFNPQQSNATANKVGAKVEPSSGARKECAWASSATSVFPARWKVAAARIRIEALITKAKHNAIEESMVANVDR